MKKLFILISATLLVNSLSFATIRRVGFFGPAVNGVDYTNFQLAHDASTAGDTIMMMPGSRFASNTLSKRLVIIGPGYFLSQNTGLQANPLGMDSADSYLTISDAAASGSIFMSCTIGSGRLNAGNGVVVSGLNVTNISFIRCWFIGDELSDYGFRFSNNISNIIFQQCVFKNNAVSADGYAIGTNLSFLNCLFYNTPRENVYYYYFLNFTQDVGHSGLIQNCVFSGIVGSLVRLDLRGGSWAFNNNISNNFEILGTGINYQNNIGTGDQYPPGNGNLQNQTWANIFTLNGSQDGQYALTAGSPAIGAGIGGINCGIFGGTTPYRLSGIPSVPTIYSFTSPQGVTPTVNTVQINLSTRSNN